MLIYPPPKFTVAALMFPPPVIVKFASTITEVGVNTVMPPLTVMVCAKMLELIANRIE